MQVIINVRCAVLFVVLGLVGMAAPAVAQTCQWSRVGDPPAVAFGLTGFDGALYAGGPFSVGVAKWGRRAMVNPWRHERHGVRVDGV
jgi:hypothetical protein